MQIIYVCQICNHTSKDRPPEWCPKCNGHRVIFKRLFSQTFGFPIGKLSQG